MLLHTIYGPTSKLVQYLVILDEDTKIYNRLSHRNGDVPSVWTEVLNGRVGTFRDLNRRSYSDVYQHYRLKDICYHAVICCHYGLNSPNYFTGFNGGCLAIGTNYKDHTQHAQNKPICHKHIFNTVLLNTIKLFVLVSFWCTVHCRLTSKFTFTVPYVPFSLVRVKGT